MPWRGSSDFAERLAIRRWKRDRRTAPSRWWASSSSREPRSAPPGWQALIVDTPCRDRALYRTIKVPTLVMGNRQDPIHPWEVAETVAGLIPDAELCEITPKSVSVERHAEDVKKAVDSFLGGMRG